jgi:phosphoglycerate dehydrogenase-like enzyme
MASRYRILVAFPIHEEGLKILRELGEVIIQTDPREGGGLCKALRGIDALIIGPQRLSSESIRAADKLQVIGRHGVGFDNIDLTATTERGIVVTWTPGILGETVADLTFGLIISIMRRIPQGIENVRSGRWNSGMELGSDVHGKTIGIVGLGDIGSRVARRALGFGMTILYVDSVRKSPELERELQATYVQLDLLLQEADIVSIHVPLTEKTKNMISGRELSLMKKGAYLINTSRGGVIDEEMLCEALKKGTISGAALDVLTNEPPSPSNHLLGMENVVITPHMA